MYYVFLPFLKKNIEFWEETNIPDKSINNYHLLAIKL